MGRFRRRRMRGALLRIIAEQEERLSAQVDTLTHYHRMVAELRSVYLTVEGTSVVIADHLYSLHSLYQFAVFSEDAPDDTTSVTLYKRTGDNPMHIQLQGARNVERRIPSNMRLPDHVNPGESVIGNPHPELHDEGCP